MSERSERRIMHSQGQGPTKEGPALTAADEPTRTPQDGELPADRAVAEQPATKEWWDDPRMPWKGKPRRADIWCIGLIIATGLYGMLTIPVRPWILGNFGVPARGSLLLLYALTFGFILGNLGLGLLVSTLARTQAQAMQVGFFFLLPNILLSGFMFPREAMPAGARWVGLALPLTYYLRVLRGKTTTRTPADEPVRIGGSRTLRENDGDDVTLIACGVTVDEAVDAAETLAKEDISARVIDCYSVKPLDEETVRSAAAETGAIVTVEDHRAEGGLGDAVLAVLADAPDRPPVIKLAVDIMPTSGTPEELMRAAGIDAEAIVDAARTLCADEPAGDEQDAR